MDNLTTQQIKGYEIQERLANGGFGTVYRAYQANIGREVAIKVILPRLANEPDFIRRFEAEAQIIARLEHPFIVPLYDYWRDPDGAYLVMRYLRGGSLHDYIRKQGALSIEDTLKFFSQVTQGLHIAHRNQVIHRDIKPDNILLDEDGNSYLADFGIAKNHMTSQNITEPDSFIGSPEYLAPEQARSEAVTPQTDIYSLGVVLYEMLTGEHPFGGIEKIELIFKHLNDPLPEIVSLDDSICDAINGVIQKATAKDPKKRFVNVMEMLHTLQQAARLDAVLTPTNLIELLTPREQEVLQLIIDGKSNREIADLLVLTEGTVKQYIKSAYRKLNVRSRVQAIARARDMNFLIKKPVSSGNISTGHLPEPQNPFKGLKAFQPADSRDFFGREKLIQKLLKRMQENGEYKRFLAVVGPSGSGKSSVVKAGLIPSLWRGDFPGSEKWYIVDMLPGDRPLDELEVALYRVVGDRGLHIRAQLDRDQHGLLRAAEMILPDDGSELLLVIDQLEEVFTLLENEAARHHFLNLLHTAVTAKRSRVRVLVTLRADYYDRPLQYPNFGEMMRNRVETVLPLSAEELERAVSEPAIRQGVVFEDGLVSHIISDVHYQAGALPLLQFALTELFDRREGRTLTQEAYQAIGGTGGALANRADEIFLEMDDQGREMIRQLFLRLVTLGEGAEDTRRRARRSELMDIAANREVMDELIDLYSASRLLSLDNDPTTRQPTVEVAHEAILREWERLRWWLNESREDIRQERLVAQVAEDWQANQHDASYLLRGSRLEHFENWRKVTDLVLTPLESEFIKASVLQGQMEAQAEAERQAHEARQERRSQRLLQALVAVFAIATILSGGFGIFALIQRNNAIISEQKTVEALAVSRRSGWAFAANSAIERDEMDVAIALAVESANGNELLPETLRVLERISDKGGPRVWIDRSETLCDAEKNRDGQYLIASDCREHIKLWNVTSGELVQTFAQPGIYLTRAGEMSPNNQLLITADNDNHFALWDVASGEIINQFEIEGDLAWYRFAWDEILWVLHVDPNADYRVGGKVSLYDVRRGELLNEYNFERVHGLTFSADGHLGAIGTRTNDNGRDSYRIHIYDTKSGDILHTFDRPIDAQGNNSQGANLMEFSPDGSQLLFGGYPNYVIDLATGKDIVSFGLGPGDRIDKNFDKVIVHGAEGWYAVDLQTGEEELLGSFNGVWFGPDSQSVVSSPHGTPQYIQLWDLKGRDDLVRTVYDDGAWFSNVFNPQGGQFASVNGYGIANTPFVRVSDTDTWDVLFHLEDAYYTPFDIDWSANGKYIAVGTVEGVVIILDAQSGSELHRLTDIDQVWSRHVKFTGDSRYLIAAHGSVDIGVSYDVPPYLVIWDVETGDLVNRIEFPDADRNWGIENLSIQANGHLAHVGVLATYTNQNHYLVDLYTGEIIRELDSELEGYSAFTPDGKELVIGAFNGNIYVLSAETGEILRQWKSLDTDMFTIAISPDGKYLATGSGPMSFESAVSLWDLQTGKLYRRYLGHVPQSFVQDVDFSPDGRQLASSAFGTIQLWQVNTQSSLDWVLENRVVRELNCSERELYRVEPLCEE